MTAVTPSSKSLCHVIVGDGLAAGAFAETVHLDSGDELVVIGSAAQHLGRGIAYAVEPQEAPWQFAYLLNSPANDIDKGFADWLETHWDKVQEQMAGRQPDWLSRANRAVEQGLLRGLNVPRAIFGDYLEERSHAALDALRAKGVTVTLISEDATGIEIEGDQFAIMTERGQVVLADRVDVATGGPKDQRIQGDDSAFSAPTLFGNEERIATHLKTGGDVWCIGTNATMLDVLRLCQSVLPEDQIRMKACSPRGVLPAALLPRVPGNVTQPDLRGPFETAEDFLAAVEQAVQAAFDAGDLMGEIRAGFRNYFLDVGLSSLLPNMEEARKVNRKLGHVFRGGTKDTIQDFHRLTETGVTEVVKARVTSIEPREDGADILALDADGQDMRLNAGFVVNCSGPGGAFILDPFTQSLVDKGWISICTKTGGFEVGTNLNTKVKGLRHLSPATTVIGDEVLAMPAYDAHVLRAWIGRANEGAC